MSSSAVSHAFQEVLSAEYTQLLLTKAKAALDALKPVPPASPEPGPAQTEASHGRTTVAGDQISVATVEAAARPDNVVVPQSHPVAIAAVMTEGSLANSLCLTIHSDNRAASDDARSASPPDPARRPSQLPWLSRGSSQIYPSPDDRPPTPAPPSPAPAEDPPETAAEPAAELAEPAENGDAPAMSPPPGPEVGTGQMRRVTLRPPQNEERGRVTHIEDLQGHSCRSVYSWYCKQYEVRPKQAVKGMMPDTANEFPLSEMVLDQSAFIGNKGLLPLLEVVRLNQGLTRLVLRANGIKNSGVEWLVHAVLDHASLACIDLSENRITSASGTLLVYLAHRNPRIVEVDISQTKIDDLIRQRLQARLKANQAAQLLQFPP